MQGTVSRKLSIRQKELLFAQLARPDSAALNVGAMFTFDSVFDRAAVQRAVTESANRHDALRTRLGRGDDGEHVAIIDATASIDLRLVPVIDEEEALRQVIAIQDEPFRDDGGLRYAWSAIVTPAGRWYLLLTAHHMLVDGWSLSQLVEDLAAEILGIARPQVPTSWETIADAEMRYEASRSYTDDSAFWASQAPPHVPTYAGPSAHDTQHRLTHVQSWQSKAEFELLGGEGGNPVHAVLERVYQLLCTMHGRDVVTIAFSTLNRPTPVLRETVGYTAGTVLIHHMGEPTRTERIEALGKTMRSLYRHHRLPLGAMLRASGRVATAMPADATFTVVTRGGQGLLVDGVLRRPEQTFGSHASTPLQIYVDPEVSADGVVYNLLFDRHHFSPALIAWFAERLLHGLSDPVDAATRAPDEDDGTLATDIVAIAHAWPERIAIDCGEHRLTYAELVARVADVGRDLSGHVVAGATVGILMEPSIDRVVAFLAIIASGRTYLGIDHHQPPERLRSMVARASADAVLADADCMAAAATLGCKAIAMPAVSEPDDTAGGSWDRTSSLDAAYVIFTSGSTGEPKGVVTTHQGLAALRQALRLDFDIPPTSRILQFARTSFDASIFEMVAAFANGATLVVPRPSDLMYGAPLAEFMNHQRVSFATLPPSVVASMGSAEVTCLGTLVVAGEACSAEVANRWSAGRRFINAYGPTEAAICATAHLHRDASVPPLGQPVGGASVYLLDDQLNPTEGRGIEGEIYIAGPGLARGYAGQGALTAASFLANPFGPAGSRMYRTGDRAVRSEDGLLHFVGRRDRQFKLRGHRIEAGEIESRLLAMHGITEAVVDCVGAGDEARLVAYMVAPTAPSDDAILQALSETLPGYMLPSRIVRLSAMPLTAHGKIDRGRLGTTSAAEPPVALIPQPDAGSEEAIVEAVWCELLGERTIQHTKTFFEAGGNSLLLVRMIEMVNARASGTLSIADVLSASSISALARKLRKDRGGAAGWQARLRNLVGRERPGETP